MLECKNGEVQSEKLFGEKLILLTGIGPNDVHDGKKELKICVRCHQEPMKADYYYII
jgi:hypothetical protein